MTGRSDVRHYRLATELGTSGVLTVFRCLDPFCLLVSYMPLAARAAALAHSRVSTGQQRSGSIARRPTLLFGATLDACAPPRFVKTD